VSREADSDLDYEQLHLVKMANQIAANVPNRSNIATEVSNHMRTFWTPVMRRDITTIAQGNPNMLEPEVLAALDQLQTVEA